MTTSAREETATNRTSAQHHELLRSAPEASLQSPVRLQPARVPRHRARALLEIGGRRVPFMRWSFIRLLLSMRRLMRVWQVGDGREERLADYVVQNAREGDLDDVIRAIDEYCYERSYMINVGDEKGAILDEAVRRARPSQVLELGTYCGYSALRICRAMPDDARVVSIEFNAANALIAHRILEHAGIIDRVAVLVGTLGDGGRTIATLEAEHGLAAGSLDFVFIDHDKNVYLSDLELILGQGWLHPGSVVIADNVKFPGAPEYRAYLKERQDQSWRTVEHEAHLEYQTLIKDLMLESDYLGGPA
ncbi:MAG: O-methyltransferase [Solirubrobacterales bacterium]|nr:O-methyltransferase [Solirubrobacterales bacterium]